MPLRFKRRWTPYGEMIQRKGKKGSNLLITRNGKKLLLNFRKLLSGVWVEPKGNLDIVHFSPELHPKPIGEGAHGMLFVLSPKEEASFRRRGKQSKEAHRPSVVLKVYRESTPRELEPDGFTQFYANEAVYKYLQGIHSNHFVARPLQYYFVSDKLAVRNFIRAPTLEEVQESFTDARCRRKPISLALNDRQISHIVKLSGITLKKALRLQEHIESVLKAGQKVNFNASIPIKHDPMVKNFFLLGKNSSGQFIISAIDQGRLPVPGLAQKMLKGEIH